jgi:hypothetical protein
LLNFEKPIVLTPQQVIEFFVQAPDFQLGFQVDFVIVFAAQSVADSMSIELAPGARCISYWRDTARYL